jgi:hypothetical protein
MLRRLALLACLVAPRLAYAQQCETILATDSSKVPLAGGTMTGVLTNSSGFVGPLTGNVTGNMTGNVTGAVVGNATTATALATNGANCSANSFPLGVDASGAVESCSTNISGNSATATALAANGANCSAGNYPLGVDASGAVEGCAAVGTGDVTQAGNNTFTGTNVFNSTTSFATPISSNTIISLTGNFTASNSFPVCVATGTINLPVQGNIMVGFNGDMYESGTTHYLGWWILVDGQFTGNATGGLANQTLYNDTGGATLEINPSSSYPVVGLASGAHNICFAPFVTGGATGSFSANSRNIFWFYRLP